MEDISRMASPMGLCEEDLFDVHGLVERKKKALEEWQKQRPAAFLIGSIDEVNQRISSLDNELQSYQSLLAIEQHSAAYDNLIYNSNTGAFFQKPRIIREQTRSGKIRDEKESKRFAGKFSQASALVPEFKFLKKKSPVKHSDAPRMVELEQYPGFDDRQCTPLPQSLDPIKVIDRVVSAQPIMRKHAYRQKCVKMLNSEAQCSILQDTFWWFFLNKYHPDKESQSRLFQRISANFGKMLLYPNIPKFKDRFFIRYPDLLAQSIYSVFCFAFPQSWRQFDDSDFKETVISTCTTWISGIRPLPRRYEKWYYTQLEPPNMRKDESMKTSHHKERRTPADRTASSLSSTASKASALQSRLGLGKSLVRQRSGGLSSSSSPRAKSYDGPERLALSPITEIPSSSDDESYQPKPVTRRKRSSCPSGSHVVFERCVFNINGGSPLMGECLQQNGLQRRAGVDHLIRRTQIASYGPLECSTFNDVINTSTTDVRKTTSAFKKIHDENTKAVNTFESKLMEDKKSFDIKAEKVLSKPRQVRYLSSLILLETQRDVEDVNLVGAASALNSALAAETAH